MFETDCQSKLNVTTTGDSVITSSNTSMPPVDPKIPDPEITRNGVYLGQLGCLGVEVPNLLCDRLNEEAKGKVCFDWNRLYNEEVQLYCLGDLNLGKQLLTKHIKEWFLDAAIQDHQRKYPGLNYTEQTFARLYYLYR